MPRNVEPGLPVQNNDDFNLGDDVIVDETVPGKVTGRDEDDNILISEKDSTTDEDVNSFWGNPDKHNIKKR